jgi:hypothetical protein
MRINSGEKAESFLWSAVSQDYLEVATTLWEKNLAEVPRFVLR